MFDLMELDQRHQPQNRNRTVRILQRNRPLPHSTSVCTNNSTRLRLGGHFHTFTVILSTLTSIRRHCSLECGKGLLYSIFGFEGFYTENVFKMEMKDRLVSFLPRLMAQFSVFHFKTWDQFLLSMIRKTVFTRLSISNTIM